jgi:copper resistance protein B
MDGWYGNTNRLWLKSEGKSNTAFKSGYNMDMQVLYGRLIAKYYDFQVGVRVENQTSNGGEETARAHFVIGLHEFVTDRYEVESAFISQDEDVSARFQTSRELMLTQRLILQACFETNAAIQRVERFTTGRGINNVEFGVRLCYEIRRQTAPYVCFIPS